jgi:hypothetical protein
MIFKLRLLSYVLCFVIALPVYSSVFDRIDNCERSGGGACVFSLLRELAGKQPTVNKCACSSAKADVRSDCFMKEEYSLKIDGRLLETGCGEDADKAYANCLIAMKKHQLCL